MSSRVKVFVCRRKPKVEEVDVLTAYLWPVRDSWNDFGFRLRCTLLVIVPKREPIKIEHVFFGVPTIGSTETWIDQVVVDTELRALDEVSQGQY